MKYSKRHYQELIFDLPQLYERILKFFQPYELVSDEAWEAYKHKGSEFFLSHFDPRLLIVILWIRETLGIKITINNWYWGGIFSQRGLRDNLQNIVKSVTKKGVVYFSGHPLGMAFDYDVDGVSAPDHRDWLESKADECPFPIRLENKKDGKEINWNHLDVKCEPKNPNVYRFNI